MRLPHPFTLPASRALVLAAFTAVTGEAGASTWPDVALRIERDLASPDPVARRSAAPRLVELGPARGEPLVLRALDDPDLAVQLAAAHAAVRLGISAATLAVLPWLKAPAAAQRLAACEVVASLPSPQAVTPVSRALNDGDPAVRAAAADALGASGERDLALPPLLGKLEDPSPAVRVSVVRALGGLADVRAVVPLIGKLQDSVVEVRRAAARTLGALADDRAVASLSAALHDGAEDVQVAAMMALGSLGTAPSALPGASIAAAVNALAPWVLDRKLPLRSAALVALGRLGGDVAVAALVGALGTAEDGGGAVERTPVREALLAAEGALASGPDTVRGALLRVLAHPPSDAVASSAAWVLGTLGDRAAAPALERAMRSFALPNDAGLHALAGAGTARELPLVLELITDPSARVRQEARNAALALLDPRRPDGRAAEPLEAALNDPRLSPVERAEVLSLLGATGTPRVAPVLARYLRSPEASVRLAAIDALGRVGAGFEASPLVDTLLDDDSTVRVHAALALAEAGGPKERDALLKWLDAPDRIDHATLLAALGGILARSPADEAVERLEASLASAAGAERDAVLEAVGRAPTGRARSLLAEFASSPDADDRRAAMSALGGQPEALATVRAGLADRDPTVRAEAAWALGAVGTADDEPRLLARATDEAAVSANAMAALGRLGARASRAVSASGTGVAAPSLCALLATPLGPYARANAIASLSVRHARCGDGAAERALLSSSPEEAVREAAARLLGAVPRGPDDRAALLACAQNDRSGHVARACVDAAARSARPASAGLTPEVPRAVTVYVSDGTGAEPAPHAPFAVATPDGFVRVGVTDRRGAFFDPRVPAGPLALRSPSPASLATSSWRRQGPPSSRPPSGSGGTP